MRFENHQGQAAGSPTIPPRRTRCPAPLGGRTAPWDGLYRRVAETVFVARHDVVCPNLLGAACHQAVLEISPPGGERLLRILGRDANQLQEPSESPISPGIGRPAITQTKASTIEKPFGVRKCRSAHARQAPGLGSRQAGAGAGLMPGTRRCCTGHPTQDSFPSTQGSPARCRPALSPPFPFLRTSGPGRIFSRWPPARSGRCRIRG